MREAVIDRIVQRVKQTENRDILEYEITDEMVIKEYSNVWLENIKMKDKMNMLYNHPGLLQEDYDKLSVKIKESTNKKFKYAGYTTLGVLFIYNLGFKNSWYFYNWFNKKPWIFQRLFIGRKIKKMLLVYAVYTGSLYSYNYFFDKQLVLDLKREGFYDKYNLEFYFNELTE